ncbi:Similar to SrpRalpha: Signal recognition particle receptor subunit alpha homolog (Drosophila melanogaster) [Cotesia congregata]|uniref:Similar to SrpRalpha: Signal recognition particle receptor subunit alpha homolog (Drosophila melanogaster) n=1 Tax=Cotesia congregata TaxID=51543 RepID=A0A8J2HL06_COTCN|nr:Similar to SrpRalpha: Signal recognition particle receptor subunit alpha homolog (Drosophila melanogaster) [Cotesia congregata]
MLDFFTIFTKSGLVLWCSRYGYPDIFTPAVNALIRSVILQERTGVNSYEHESLRLQYKLDNEFELVFVVAYQKILQLSYVDKFLNDIHLEFRDKYNDFLIKSLWFWNYKFDDEYKHVLASAEKWGKQQAAIPKQMPKKKKTNVIDEAPVKIKDSFKENDVNSNVNNEDDMNDDVLVMNRLKLAQKFNNQKKKPEKQKSPKEEKVGKKPRVWELGGTNKDLPNLERTKDKITDTPINVQANTALIGKMEGPIPNLEVPSDSEDEINDNISATANKKKSQASKSSGGMFSMLKGLVGNKSLTQENLDPVLEKMKDHLIMKNVAADISMSLCNSVRAKLEGKVLGTFESVASTVKNTLTDSLVQILSPKRRVDILRDAYEAKKNGRPYVMSFCGVNGVGKSTNLAKICFWLIENNFRVLIAACDTFRAGAVEQLRTHMRHLNALHPPEKHGNVTMVELYEKGYGKDAAGIASEAIRYARDCRIDIVLIDTAGRMQDNEPLMRALAKLIKVNQPDLVLFVGEALVGNEAVDQLVKFNRALEDYSNSENPRTIDGIVLTKFDTIDDKVGAAISMTYITGQPIVFVGTGQTYTDLKTLNAKAVVHALMK